jgi:uncharacterized protein YkwD
MMPRRHLPLRRLVLVLALAGVLAPSPGGAADLATTRGYAEWAEAALANPPADVRFLDELERKLAELTAAARREQAPDAAPLERDPGLERAARAHALDLLERGYMDHVDGQGRAVGERVGILARRFIGGAGENLAEHAGIPIDRLGDQTGPLAEKLVDGWMASAGHRENLLQPAYNRFGLAAAGAGERLVVVHVFGQERALLAEPLPLALAQGAELPLALEATEGAPQKFAFAPPGKSLEDLVTLELSSSAVVVDPGEYRLEFFFPSERDGYFEIVDGPALVVTEG